MGQALGRHLMEEVFRRAGEARKKTMVACIDDDNVGSVAFQVRMGASAFSIAG